MKHILLATSALACAAFMSDGPIPTVTVKGEDGQPLRINQSDYEADPSAYELYESANAAADDAAAAARASAPNGDGGNDPAVVVAPAGIAPMVASEGTGRNKRFYIVDPAGAKLTGEGIEADGYETDAAAWAAVVALAPKTP